jgi:hypothetical protein
LAAGRSGDGFLAGDVCVEFGRLGSDEEMNPEISAGRGVAADTLLSCACAKPRRSLACLSSA